jgi:D-alanyl-D-alanine carboxypeptidase/D-alanyl-D-alanine-endopeptidase (penicillin-binding protein 4)
MARLMPTTPASWFRARRLPAVVLLPLIVSAIAQPTPPAPPVGIAPPVSAPSVSVSSESTSKADTDQTLAQWFKTRLEAVDWEGGEPAILIQDAEVPLTVFERQADALVLPGSLVQLVTAAAALDRLGPSFHFSTEFFAVHPDPDKRAARAIVVRGTGDPSLSLRYLGSNKAFWQPLDEWARTLRRRKIVRVEGPVIGDASAFDDQWAALGWPRDRRGDSTLPSVAALNFNDNCIEIDWRGKAHPGKVAEFSVFPQLPRYIFISSDVRVAQPVRRERSYERVKDGNLIVASGEVPYKGEAHDRAAIENPARFFAEALRARLVKAGIDVLGPATALSDLPPGQVLGIDEVPLGVRFSPLLPELLGHMVRDDATLDAEVLFKTLGRRRAGASQPGSFAGGTLAMQDYLDIIRLPGPYYNLVDGSGRSTINRLSPRQLVYILRQARLNSATGTLYDDLFPRAGALSGRFQPPKPEESGDAAKTAKGASGVVDPATLPIWVKTASGEGLEAAAGRLRTRTGRVLLFAVLINGSRMPSPLLRRQVDQLLIDLTR